MELCKPIIQVLTTVLKREIFYSIVGHCLKDINIMLYFCYILYFVIYLGLTYCTGHITMGSRGFRKFLKAVSHSSAL